MELRSIWKKGRDEKGSGDGTDPVGDGYRPRKKLVLMAGLFYLGLILFGMFAQVTRMGLIVSGDAAATVENIIASNGMLHFAFVSDILAYTCYVLLGLTCYLIFKTINSKVALIMLTFVVISGSYAIFNMLNVFDALQMISGHGPLTAGESEMVLTYLDRHVDGSYVSQVIGWGPWLIPLGYLGYRSDFFPNIIGIVLIAGGAGLTVQGLQYFLVPGLGDVFAPGAVISMIAEFSTCGWFLYRGRKGFGLTAGKSGIESNDARTAL